MSRKRDRVEGTPSNRPPARARRTGAALAIGIAASALVLGVGAGAAYAFFFSNGAGSGSAIGATLRPVSVLSANASPSTALLPGGTADLVLTLDNQNGFLVTITGISQDGPVTVAGGSGCTSDSGTWPSITLGNSGVSVPASVATGLSTTLPSGTNNLDIPSSVTMSTNSYTGCQGASFQIPVTVTVQK